MAFGPPIFGEWWGKMGLAIIGVVFNLGVAGMVAMSGEYPTFLSYIMGLLVAVSVIGVVVALAGARRPGAIMVIIGAVGFVPIGLVAAYGARKILDAVRDEEFEARRGSE